MKKELYKAPELTVELFKTEDVITASDPDGPGWTDFFPCSVEEDNSKSRF